MEGRVVQVGTPSEVYARPANVAVAGFIGNPPMNLIDARVEGGFLRVQGQAVALDRDAGADGDVTLGVRASALRLADEGLPVRVELVEHLGDSTIVDLDAGGRLLKMRADARPPVREGDSVQVAFAPGSIHLFERPSGNRR
jgi:ABC-type sugar transport system ATPase subunit